MSDEDAFLQAIADAPGDDTTPLVYADWLEERGDSSRANSLRLECAWAALPAHPELQCRWREALPPDEGRYPPVLRRLSEAVRAVDIGWFASFSRVGREVLGLVDRFEARIPVSRPARVPEVAAAQVARWQSAVTDVRRMFEGHVGERVTQERFVVPVDYALFGAMTDDGLTTPDLHGRYNFDFLTDPAAMAAETISYCDMYAEDHGGGEHLAACGLWLLVGRRDKHDLHVCCDRASPLFGVVVDQHDSHPWIDPPDGPTTWEVLTRSFLDFLRWQVAKAERAGDQ
jgi:uncharacterized protein (TIGR02996 family)